MTLKRITYLAHAFWLPLTVVAGLILYLLLSLNGFSGAAIGIAYISIFLGSYKLLKETFEDIRNKQFGLDYIAIVAVAVSIITHEYLVGIILGLMLASGRNLEEFAARSAKKSLSSLAERIPHYVTVELQGVTTKKSVTSVEVGEIIVVRKGEVIPLDGLLLTKSAVVDESTLTGEAFPVDKYEGDILRSGILNLESVINVKVTKSEKDSTYKKIVLLVQRAQSEKAPMVRLADTYSLYFTLITAAICVVAYLIHPSLESILAVLVVATPCPLILATPIALMGGMNAQAKRRIIIKKLSSIEVLSRVNTVVFDKTGTITLGKPVVTDFICTDKSKRHKLLSIAGAIERNSLHPLAKAVVEYTKDMSFMRALNVKEEIGKGISGVVEGSTYSLVKIDSLDSVMRIGFFSKDKKIGEFTFEDEIKNESKIQFKH